jgi:hypothetical protein
MRLPLARLLVTADTAKRRSATACSSALSAASSQPSFVGFEHAPRRHTKAQATWFSHIIFKKTRRPPKLGFSVTKTQLSNPLRIHKRVAVVLAPGSSCLGLIIDS